MSLVIKELGIRRKEIGDIGVEIEVEGRNLPRCVKYWRNEQDGSLKGEETAEYVLGKPYDLHGVDEALNYLDQLYNECGTVVDNSVRAGVHIHINCQALTITQLYNYITTYLLLENLLVHWCGEFREGNLFCLRTCDAEWMLGTLKAAARDPKHQFRQRFHRDDLRYSSMNVKALGDYGSLEFRAMRGTRDLKLIYKWAETLFNLRQFACTFNKPTDIIEQFSIGGINSFLERALGKNMDMFTNGVDYQKLVWQGMRNAQDVAFCTDWDAFDPEMMKIGGLDFPKYLNSKDINEPMEDV